MRLRSLATAVLVASATASAAACTPAVKSAPSCPVAEGHAAAPRTVSPVVLVTIDGARWQDVIDAPRLMPTLHRMATEDGALVGGDARVAMRASNGTFVSLPGYAEIMSGAPSDSCFDNSCPQTRVPTLLDRAHAAGRGVAAFASWERLYRVVSARPGTFVISAGKDGGYRPDTSTADLALAHLERNRPDLLFLSLGDADEEAHRGNVVGYRDALARADMILGRLRATLARMGERGRATNIIVTADHGRANDFRSHGAEFPESARVWLVASGPDIDARGASRSPRPRRLADVAPTIAALMGIDAPCGGDVLTEIVASASAR